MYSTFAELLNAPNRKQWDILIVDDEKDVHALTRLALSKFEFEGIPLSFSSAYSAAEAKERLNEIADVAVVLLDVVMETQSSGLDLVKYIRQAIKNRQVRIVLRTGQPGAAPERAVVDKFDINDYKEKSELTAGKLYTTVRLALKAFKDIHTIETQKAGLQWALDQKTRAELAKSEFLANVSHELRTPLNAILGYSEILCQQTFGPLGSEKYVDYARSINSSGKSLLSSVSNLIDLTEGASSPDPASATQDEVFDLWTLVTEVIELVMPKSFKAARRKTDGQQSGIAIMGRRNEIKKVLVEIVSNSLKHGTDGTSVSVGVLRRKDGVIAVVVRDNGPGIPKGVVEKLGQPFLIDGSPMTSGTRGLGVGLALASIIMSRHGGRIEAQNIEPRGAEVAALFPAERVSHV